MKKSLIFIGAALALFATACQQPDPFEGREPKMASFEFKAADNEGVLARDCSGVVGESTIDVTVPFGTDVTRLKATFKTVDDESKVKVAGKAQVSGKTANDFSSPVEYVVTLGELKSLAYTVTVTVEHGAPALTSFAFKAADNKDVIEEDIIGTVGSETVSVIVPFGTDVTALKASFEVVDPESKVTVGETVQESGKTANDFSSPVEYVVAVGGKSGKFTVNVTVENGEPRFTAFAFKAADNEGLEKDCEGIVEGQEITVVLPFGTDVTALKASYEVLDPASAVTVGGTAQESGVTANDFTEPVEYTVSVGEKTGVYIVKAVVENGDPKFLSYGFKAADNAGVIEADCEGVIVVDKITVHVPFGTDVKALKAAYEVEDPVSVVTVAGSEQVSGVTANDFSSVVEYRISVGGKEGIYGVEVVVDPGEPVLTGFAFLAKDNEGVLLADCEGRIDGTSVAVEVPYGTNLKALKAVFTVLDPASAVAVGSAAQESGVTANDFSSPVEYVVTNAGKSEKYTVTVTSGAKPQWALASKHSIKPGYMAMNLNPKTGAPVVAVVENVGSSRGPLWVINGSEAARVSAQDANPCQYAAVGASEDGTIYAYTNDYASKSADRRGNVYKSNGGASWTKEDVQIDYTNNYWGRLIGCIGKEVFVMTCNNAAGGVPKRNINVTSFDGSAWTTGKVLANRATSNTYWPVMRVAGDALYTFVTNVGSGLSIYKYQGGSWSEVITVEARDEYAAYAYGIYGDGPDMAIAPDGQIYLGLGTTTPLGATVVKINPNAAGGPSVSQVGSTIALTNSVSARHVRVAVDPLGGVHLVYRDDNKNLCDTALDKDTLEWGQSVILCGEAGDDFDVVFNSRGEGFVSCSSGDETLIYCLK